MPFKSEKQRRFLWAKHPEIAKRWADEYPGQKNLPMYANQGEEEPAPAKEKAAFILPGKKLTFPFYTGFFPNTVFPMKQANSIQKYIEIPHSDEPTYAGEEHAEVADSGKPVQEGGVNAPAAEKMEKSPLLQKLSAVLSRPLLQFLEDEKATQQARLAARIPQNANLKQYPVATPTIPPPMGMAQAPAQPAPQAQPQQPAQPAQARPVGNNAGPTANPINSFGALSASGQLNGNAAFGIKNSPDSLKTAQSESLARVMNMDFPPYPDPEDLDLDDEERMKTSSETAPNSRINKSLRKWNCKCGSAFEFGKMAAKVVMPYPKHKPQYAFPEQVRKSTMTKDEAAAIANAMTSAAPHGALDNTRVDLNGSIVRDLQQRTVDNPRSAPMQRYLARFDNVEGLPDKTQLLPDAYHTPSDTVWLPSGNPAIMMHELGHAIDFNGYPNNTPRMLMAGAYKRLAPTLWHEHAAWNKGQRHFLEGAAQKKLDPKLVVRTLEDAARAKNTGLGSYWGAGIGGLAGLGLGAYGTYALAQQGRAVPQLPFIGLGLGGSLGAMAGLGIGNHIASAPRHSSPEARQKYLDAYANTYAQEHGQPREAVISKLMAQLKAKHKRKAKKEAPRELRKAAGA
jgi:hypothetical protein